MVRSTVTSANPYRDPPASIKPQLAALVKSDPDGHSWLHEIKLDGYRMHARLDAGRVKIMTRRGNDWTDKYPSIANALVTQPALSAYLDGEVCQSGCFAGLIRSNSAPHFSAS